MISRENDAAAARFDILFETERFNVSKVQKHFINPCCFGEDLAEWLRQKLNERGVNTGIPGQEDWGWYLLVRHNANRYFVGVGGHRREGAPSDTNTGEWRIMIEKRRSLWDRLRGANKITPTEPIISIVETILGEQSDIHNLHREPL